MLLKNIDDVLAQLEKEELDNNEEPSSHLYSQILAIYLYKNELCFAKYLWKRIPSNIKDSSPDLRNIWDVAQKMWQRDWEGVHIALNHEWNENITEIMETLRESVRERALNLMSDAYSSLDIVILAKMLGLSYDESCRIVLERGWTITGNVVKPKKTNKQLASNVQTTITEDQLFKLTQFVSFLEN